MLAKITLENFFSFGDSTTIELNPGVNILIGINGSGKSNFIKSIQLLYESISGRGFEKLFLGGWGGFPEVANFSKSVKDSIKLTFEFDKRIINQLSVGASYVFKDNPIYELTIFSAGGTSYYLKELCHDGKKGKEPFVFLDMKNGKGVISTLEGGKVKFEKNYEMSPFSVTEPIMRQISDPYRYLPLFTLKQAIQNLSIYSCFNTSSNSSIRIAKNVGSDNRLLPDGENLTSVLQKLQINHPLEYEQIENAIGKINPYFKGILFNQWQARSVIVLREKELAKTVSMDHISDGTLQFLLLLSIFFNPERGTLVCVDEPEKGLHPDMTRTIAKAIQSVGSSQCIIATHSPLLLNAFSLNDVFIFEKDALNQTQVVQKTKEDFSDLGEGILLGQLWLNGQLGGKRW